MTNKKRYPHVEARKVAYDIMVRLTPYSEKILIAGSIRREREDVGDIELLIVPKFRVAFDMFMEPRDPVDTSDERLANLVKDGVLKRRGAWGHLNKFFTHVLSGIPVDIFVGTIENWGRDLMVRTGSADFNKRVMSRFHALGKRGHAYGDFAVTHGLATYKAPDEEAMFALLEWDYIEPRRRS